MVPKESNQLTPLVSGEDCLVKSGDSEIALDATGEIHLSNSVICWRSN